MVLWLAILVPPAVFILTLLLKRDIDPTDKLRRKQNKQALKQLKKNLASQDNAFEAWLTFLSHKLDRPTRTITRQDILPLLDQHPKLAGQVQQIFQTGEAIKYGGKNESLNQKHILDTAEQLHKVLK
jgi:non-ribosomal peptide synthetase component F